VAPGTSRQLRGDPLRLDQVLLNFVGNAIKFSEHGRIVIGVREESADADQLLVRFEVRDPGIGLNEDEIADLFQSFHQADPSTTRRYGGTGLGLVISKQLAELMGGTVGVDSTPGEGSTFWFTARLGRSRHFLPAGPEPMQPDVMNMIAGARILLVEDNVFSQQVGQELLEDARATVVVANNGKEAIDLLHKERFDCVLMDVQMPVMDGFEATRMIRADPRLKQTLVIAMTANAGKDDQARCLAAGMDEFVTKPIAPKQLFEVIARWLARRPDYSGRRRSAPAVQGGPKDGDGLPVYVSSDPGLLDMAALAATFGSHPDKMRKYAYMFLDSARDGLAELSEALDRGDLARAAELGHRIKSSARAIGATRFAELCQQVEGVQQGGTIDSVRELVKAMYALLDELKRHITSELTSPAGQ
jgi:CheY-like chemotaxis protein/HPt (histidine-containing phosphotransfer) domain-containing protein